MYYIANYQFQFLREVPPFPIDCHNYNNIIYTYNILIVMFRHCRALHRLHSLSIMTHTVMYISMYVGGCGIVVGLAGCRDN